MSGRSDLVDVEDLEVRRETDLAFLVFDGDREAWLPKALVERDGDTFTMPAWLAQERGLV